MKFYSTLRFAALALLVASTAAHATPGTITPERGGNGQQTPASPYPYPGRQGQNDQQDDGYQNDQDQNQDQGDGYQDDQDQNQDQGQGDQWGGDNGKDQGDRWNHDGGKNQGDDGWDKGGRDQGKNYPRPGRPDRDHRHGRPHGQRPYVETVPVRQQFLGMARLPLYMLTNNLMNLQGARLTGIVINGYSQAGMGGAFFCSSSCSPIQSVGGYPNSYYIQATGEPVNQFSGQWFLELRGNFAINSIQLQFLR